MYDTLHTQNTYYVFHIQRPYEVHMVHQLWTLQTKSTFVNYPRRAFVKKV